MNLIDPHEKLLKSDGVNYAGLFVAPIAFDGVLRHVICYMRRVHEGGMREFIDPLTDETVGSSGLYWSYENVETIEHFYYRKDVKNCWEDWD